MTQIGIFHANADGFCGRLFCLGIDAEICITPAEHSDSENAPDYRIHMGSDDQGPEIGAGWKRTGEKAGAYVAVQIDDPTFTQPLRANLFQSNGEEGSHILLWNRASKRAEAN